MKRKYSFNALNFPISPILGLDLAKEEYYTRNPAQRNIRNPFGFCVIYLVINPDKTMKLDFKYPQDVSLTMKIVHKRPYGAIPNEEIRNIDLREILDITIPPYDGRFYFDFIIYVLDATTDEYWATNLWTLKVCPDLRYYLSKDRKLQYQKIGLDLAKDYTRTFILGHVNLKTGELKSSSGISRLVRHGWIPSISLLPQPYGEMVRIIESTNDMAGVNSFVVNSFNSNLIDQIYDRWKMASLVEKRKEILYSALEGYKRKDFYSSVYILLPQIEGIITDHIKRKKSTPEPILLNRFTQFGDVIKEETYNTELTGYLTDILVRNLREAFFKTWFPYRRGGKRYRPSSISPQRHVMLHGEVNEKYFTAENCIKLICVLDAVILLSLLKKEMPAPS